MNTLQILLCLVLLFTTLAMSQSFEEKNLEKFDAADKENSKNLQDFELKIEGIEEDKEQRIGAGQSLFVPLLPVFQPVTVGINIKKPIQATLEDNCNKDALVCNNMCSKVGRSAGTFQPNPIKTLANPDDGRCLCQCQANNFPTTVLCDSLNAAVRNATCATFCRQNDSFKYYGGFCQGSKCICDCYLYDPYDVTYYWNFANK